MTQAGIALVLQGGGALGSYQGGVFEAMHAHGATPGWVCGISIGAINAAIIAGNPPERRTERLRTFWEAVTAPTALWPPAPGPLAGGQRLASATAALLFGQPGFFSPRSPLEFLPGQPVVSTYDTSALRATLERLVDFDRINHDGVRLSVGAVNVRTGHLRWFDNHRGDTIRPEHIMASGALPPGFPPVEIDGECYWDGGVVSNSPLQYVIDDTPRRSRLCVQVDLFHANGELPTNLAEVAEREKDIRYASRTRSGTETMGRLQELRNAIDTLYRMLPDELRDSEVARRIQSAACPAELDIVHLIYRPLVPQGATKDYEFSRPTMLARWQQGLADAEETFAAAPWRAPRQPAQGVRTFDVAHDRLVKRAISRAG